MLETGKRKFWVRFITQCTAGAWAVALLTFCGYVLKFNSATVGFLFLLAVVTVSILCGFWQATVTSLVAALSLDYFFQPPTFILSIADPQDWIALSAFEISALLVSRLSSQEQRNYMEATLQRDAMGKLYELSRNTLLLDLHQAPGPQLVRLINRVFGAKAIALFDANLGRLDSIGASPSEEQLARDCYVLDSNFDDHSTLTYRRVLRLGTHPIGGFAIRGQLTPLVIDALASLATIALERSLSFEKENRIQTEHQSEVLRAAVLDSLAHAFKTPLTAIRTASSGLLELGGLNAAQSDLASLIEEESIQLNDLCTRLLQTAKLETKEVALAKHNVLISDLISDAVSQQIGRTEGRAVQVAIEDPNLSILGDRDLLATIVTQYLDNAAKYSNPGSPITISARKGRSEVLVTVHNQGPTIPIEDRERIFERFYRRPESQDVVGGTGIGLSIARKAAEAHRGHVWVISDEEEGTTFFLSIPQESKRQE